MNNISLSVTPEYFTDKITNLGMSPLLLTGLLDDTAALTPSVVSARVTRGKIVLTYTLCEREGALDDLVEFLNPRSIRWQSTEELWNWAKDHRWPTITHNQGVAASRELKSDGPVSPPDNEVLRSAITERGRYQYDSCFALDSHVVAWDYRVNHFQFPVMHDFLVHQQSIDMLKSEQAAFSLNRAWLEAENISARSLDPIRRFGIKQRLNSLDAFLERLSLWENVRQQLTNR